MLHDLAHLTGACTQQEQALRITEAAMTANHPETQQIRRDLDALNDG